MPGDIDDLDVRIRRNDGAQNFLLKANKVDRNMSNNFVLKGLLSVAGGLAGKDISMGFENYTVQGKIQATDPDTYPNLENVDTGQWAHATAKEMALAQVTRAWGPDADAGFDSLHWGPRERTGMITKYSATENVDQHGQEKYTFTLEWTHMNAYIGNE